MAYPFTLLMYKASISEDNIFKWNIQLKENYTNQLYLLSLRSCHIIAQWANEWMDEIKKINFVIAQFQIIGFNTKG